MHLIMEQIVPNVIVIASPGARTFARKYCEAEAKLRLNNYILAEV